VRFTLLLLAPVLIQAQQTKLPSFDEYKVSEVFKGKPVKPHLATPFEREFRSQIREAASKGPNFAGKFTIAQWGCGSGCIQMAVIDGENGAVYRGPFKVLSARRLHTLEIYAAPLLQFRANSRLIIVSGCPEEDLSKCADVYYEWSGTRFGLLTKSEMRPIAVSIP